MHRAHVRQSTGFTLVEILVVVVILGIAGAIIVPQMGSRDDLRAAAACRMVMADLIYAQNLAITRQSNHYVDFQGEAQLYRLLQGPAMTVVQHPVSKDPYVMRFGAGGTPGIQECRIASATFTGGSATSAMIGFDELGAPLVYSTSGAQAMTSGTIVIQSGAYRMQVTVEPFTGQIRVSPVN